MSTFRIVAKPLHWRFPSGNAPSVLYRTRAGWTPEAAAALQLRSEHIARIEQCCVKIPENYSSTVEPTPCSN
jgi:hypothetical protein